MTCAFIHHLLLGLLSLGFSLSAGATSKPQLDPCLQGLLDHQVIESTDVPLFQRAIRAEDQTFFLRVASTQSFQKIKTAENYLWIVETGRPRVGNLLKIPGVAVEETHPDYDLLKISGPARPVLEGAWQAVKSGELREIWVGDPSGAKARTIGIRIELHPSVFKSIEEGQRVYDFRRGHRDWKPGPATFFSPQQLLPVEILSVEYMKLKNISKEALFNQNVPSAKAALTFLRNYYPELTLNDEMTVIHFRRR